MFRFWLMAAGALLLGVHDAGAEENDVLASRGEAQITHREFDARMADIPQKNRAAFLRDGKRFEQLVANLLLREQLAAEARAASFHEDPRVQARMELAAEHKLADAWLEHYLDSRPQPDYETLAREYYALNRSEFMSEKQVDVSHILISNESRSNEEARARALQALEELREDPGAFDELVMRYTDDPSAAENGGRFDRVSPGDMVKPFEDAAFSMSEGEISEPVYTVYGYHIIRVNEVFEPEPLAFEEVRDKLIQTERQKHRDRIRKDYLNSLAGIPTDITEEQVRAMLSRYFSEDVLAEFDSGE